MLQRGEVFSKEKAPGIKLTEISTIKSFDEVRGVLWFKTDVFVKEERRVRSFSDFERLRLLTYWDVRRHLKDAGFGNIECYGDFNFRNREPVRAKQLVFVAKK